MSEQPENLRVHVEREVGTTIVRLAGEIDLRSSPSLRGLFLSLLLETPARIILDLSQVRYIDSSGVGTIVELKRRAGRSDGLVVLVGLQARVRSIFEIAKLDRFFTITQTVDEARQI